MTTLPPDTWQSGLWSDVPHDAYHSGAAFGPPRLSASIAKRLLGECPAAAYAAHPLLGGHGQGSGGTRSTDEGTYLHDLMLGGGPEIEVMHFDNYLTKAAQAAKKEAIAAGKMPVLAKDQRDTSALQGAIDKALLSVGLDLSEFEPELTALWSREHPGGSGAANCKARIDLTCLAQGLIMDLKFSRKFRGPSDWSRGVEYRMDDLQAASNIAAIETIYSNLAGRLSFAFVVCPMDPPFLPAVVEVDGAGLEFARTRWARAEAIWLRCLETGEWPGYSRSNWEPSNWVLEKELVAQLMEQPEGAEG